MKRTFPRLGSRRTAVGYGRGTAAELAGQRAKLEAWAARAGVRLVAVLEDGPGRGQELARLGLVGALDAIRAAGAGILLVTHPSVAAEGRGVHLDVLHDLVRLCGAELRTTATPPPPPLPAPFGWRRQRGELVADAYEQTVIAKARELKAEGLGLTRIAEALFAANFVGRSGKALQYQQVRRLLAAAPPAAAR